MTFSYSVLDDILGECPIGEQDIGDISKVGLSRDRPVFRAIKSIVLLVGFQLRTKIDMVKISTQEILRKRCNL